MVKNEESKIKKTLDTVIDVLDGLIILDTGSTDKTLEIAKDICKNIPLEIYHADFVDFSTTRNILLDHCLGKSKYIMLLDANDEVRRPDILKKHLETTTADLIITRFELLSYTRDQTYTYCRACVIRNIPEIRYSYPVHEVFLYNKNTDDSLLDSEFHYYQDRSVDRNKDRHVRDAKIIENYLQKNPNDLRMRYYLCQTLSNLMDYEKLFPASINLIAMGTPTGYHDHIFYGYIFAGLSCYHNKRGNYITYFLKAYDYSKRLLPRCEPLVYLAGCLYSEGKLDDAYKYVKLACEIQKPPKNMAQYCTVQTKAYDFDRWAMKKQIEDKLQLKISL